MVGRKDIYVAKWFLFMYYSSRQVKINLALHLLACVKAWLLYLALKDVLRPGNFRDESGKGLSGVWH